MGALPGITDMKHNMEVAKRAQVVSDWPQEQDRFSGGMVLAMPEVLQQCQAPAKLFKQILH